MIGRSHPSASRGKGCMTTPGVHVRSNPELVARRIGAEDAHHDA